VDQTVINHFVKLVTTGDKPVHHYSVKKLFDLIRTGTDLMLIQEGLVQAAFWSMGEYGDLLLLPAVGLGSDEEEVDEGSTSPPTEMEIIDVVLNILKGPYATGVVKEYGVMCLVKLSARFKRDDSLL
jgi:AP-1 complex subunit gamma-1